jgi:Zn-dependent protease with chaperone function
VTNREFEALVVRIENTAPGKMGLYRSKVLLLAMAGYGYILGVLALLVTVMLLVLGFLFSAGGGYWMLKIVLAAGALAFTVLRALWVRWPEPTGIPINATEAPKLFTEVEAIQQRLGSPKVHKIFLDDDFNAAMEQRPRLGIFGWPEGRMHLGLPLMQALSLEEFRSVLAHEMGHLSGNHGRITGWVYRIRTTWMQLLQSLEQDNRGAASGLFKTFFEWYAPFLSAYSFVLARAQEYEADRCAASIAGPEITAKALVALSVRGRFLNDMFWPSLWDKAETAPEPPRNPYSLQASAWTAPMPDGKSLQWVTQSFAVKTDHVDTHPSLRDRLSALAVPVSPVEWASKIGRAASSSAAEELLGSNLNRWSLELNKRWVDTIKPNWEERHQAVKKYRARIAELAEREKTVPLNEEELWELARLQNNLEGDDAAFAVYSRIVQVNPDHLSANFEVGRILLQRGNSDGIRCLEGVMQDDPDTAPGACSLIEQFLRIQGNAPEADRYRQRGTESLDLIQESTEERNTITAKDTFGPHGLELDLRQSLRQFLTRYKHLQSAFLVRKAVKVFPMKPAYVLGILPRSPWFIRRNASADQALLHQVAEEAPLPAGTYIVLLNSRGQGALKKKIKSVPNAIIYGD